MPTVTAYWITLAICGYISFFLYLFLIALLIHHRKNKEFASSFFKIWISLGIIDCLHFLHTYFLMRVPLLGFFNEFFKAHDSGFLPRFALMVTYYCFFVQLLGNLLFALNRYTAATKLMEYEYMWTYKNKLVFILAAQWLLPVLLVAQIARQNIIYLQLEDGSFLLTANPGDFLVDNIIGETICCFVMLTSVILYILTVLSFIRHRNVSTVAIRNKHNSEIRLSVAVIIVFVAMAAFGLFQLAVTVYSLEGNELMVQNLLQNFYIISDVFAMINPWALVLMSSNVRVFMRKMVGIERNQTRIAQSSVA